MTGAGQSSDDKDDSGVACTDEDENEKFHPDRPSDPRAHGILGTHLGRYFQCLSASPERE